MVGGDKVAMEVPMVALAARMTSWAVGGRRPHLLVSLSISRWAATTGRRASDMCSRVATSVRTSVRPMWSCGAGVGGFGRCMSVQHRNQTRAHLSTQRESGSAITRGIYVNGLKEGQDIATIYCKGGQRLGCGKHWQRPDWPCRASLPQRWSSWQRPLIFPPS